jgi:hypothetical protein
LIFDGGSLDVGEQAARFLQKPQEARRWKHGESREDLLADKKSV